MFISFSVVSKLGILIVDGRQYNMPQGFKTSQATNQNQQSVVNPYTANSQPHHSGNNAAMFVASPVYAVNNASNNNNNSNNSNSCNNGVTNSNMLRAPMQITFQGVRNVNPRQQHYSNLNPPHYNCKNSVNRNLPYYFNCNRLYFHILFPLRSCSQ